MEVDSGLGTLPRNIFMYVSGCEAVRGKWMSPKYDSST